MSTAAAARMTEQDYNALCDREHQLRRDLTSARVRNATLMTAIVRAAAAASVVAVLPGPHREFDRIVFLSNGITLEHRYMEDGTWRYVQAASVPLTLAAIIDGVFAPEPASLASPLPFGGMAVL